jgi:hypothetical protein
MESWLTEVPYLNITALAVYQEKSWPRARWLPSVPYLELHGAQGSPRRAWATGKVAEIHPVYGPQCTSEAA